LYNKVCKKEVKMADIFEGSEATFTPVAGDYIRAVDDPTGTPISGNFTVTQLTTLLNTLIGGGPSTSGNVLTSNGTIWTSAAAAAGGGVSTPPGRLTLESGVPVSTTDQADKTTLYYTPYIGNKIALYNGSTWDIVTFAELSLNIAGFTASKPYDIFIYNNAGTPTLEGLIWTNATTRATALAYQDGKLIKTGAATRLYLGTIYMDAASKCQDTLLLRYVWNYYNRTSKVLKVTEATDSWNYTTATFRSANNSTANRVTCVIGVNENQIDLTVLCYTENATTTSGRAVGICVDNTNANNSTLSGSWKGAGATLSSRYVGNPGIGLHFFQWVEFSDASGTCTWYGDAGIPTVLQSGMTGVIWA
jgi:hypothetical protein